MAALLRAFCLGVILWSARQILLPSLGAAADLVVLVVPLYWWLVFRTRAAWGVLFLASLLIDVVAQPVLPIYTLTSVLTATIYLEFIEPPLSVATPLGYLANLGAWLLSWRLVRLAFITGAWLTGFSVDKPVWGTLWGIVLWFVLGFVGWGLLAGVRTLVRRLAQVTG